MEHHGPSIGSLVLVAVLAFLVPLLLNRIRAIRIPIAAGEILAGIVVGKSGLKLVQQDPTLALFNFLGLASLMFLSGMEIDLKALTGRGNGPSHGPSHRPAWLARLYHPFLVGLVIFALSLYGAYSFSLYLGHRGLVQQPLFLATIIATCGVTIIMPVLKDRGLLAEPFGQVLFNTAILGDIVPLVGLTALVAFQATGSAREALWILALGAAGVGVYRLGRRVKSLVLSKGLAHGTAQISVRAAFALMLVFVALAESVGVEAILGAFVAGLLLSALVGDHREEIVHKLDALGFGFLIPVFFLMVGVEFDLWALLGDRQALLMVPILFAGTFLIKAVPAALLWIWYPARQTAAGMVLLTTQMSVTIAASAIAHKAGAYGASIHAAVILVAILTAVTGPVAFNKLLGEQPKEAERDGFVLAGMNRLSLLVGSRLVRRGYSVAAVDRHADRVAEFEAAGIRAVLADPADAAGLEAADAAQARVLVAITEDEQANLQAAQTGRTEFQVPRAVIFARSASLTATAQQERVEVINPDLAAAALVENVLHDYGAASLLTGSDPDLQLADLVLLGGPLAGQALRQAQLPSQVLLVSILRGHEKIVPNGNTVLQAGDRLTVAGPAAGLAAMRQAISGLPGG